MGAGIAVPAPRSQQVAKEEPHPPVRGIVPRPAQTQTQDSLFDSNLGKLVSMDFSPQDAIEALTRTQNNLHLAIEILTSSDQVLVDEDDAPPRTNAVQVPQATPAPPPPPQETVPQAAIQRLTEMGFPANVARERLVLFDGDIDAALNSLLS